MSQDNILVIDDEKHLTDLLRLNLTKKGYNVSAFNDAENALDQFDSIMPDLMLLDIMMPGMDGVTFLQKVRENEEYKTIPAIFLSAKQEEKDKVFALKQGAVDYVTKPYSILEIFEKTKIHLKLRRQEKALLTFNERLQEKLEEKTKELMDAQAKLFVSGKMASIGQLAAGIAHEINNPVSYIHSNYAVLNQYFTTLAECIKLYRDETDRAGIKIQEPKSSDGFSIDEIILDGTDLIGESMEGSLKIKQIVADLKAFAHPGKSDFEECDINDVIKKCIKIAWNEIKYKAEIMTSFEEQVIVPCLAQEIGQVFLNLIINAAQAIETKGKIVVRTYDKPECVLVEIEDNGPGISPENLEKIFDPFFTTKEVGKGTGLGLAICHTIVEKHKGNISVESSLGKGTKFSILLPKMENKNEA